MSGLTRLGFAISVALLTIACSQDRTATPVAPTQQAAPASGPTPPTGSYTLSGVVVETSPQGSRPLEDVSVNAWVQQASFGYSYMWAHGRIATDAGGRFRLTSLPGSATVQLQVWKEGYVQQCAARRVTVLSDIQLDAQLVSRANLSASLESVTPPAPGYRSVSGVIFEKTDAGTRPVAGVFVDFEPTMDFPAAVTFSDAAGRYLLCGLLDNETVSIGAGLGNRVAYVSVPAGRSTGVDIMLP